MSAPIRTAEDYAALAREHLPAALAKEADDRVEDLTVEEIAALAYERSRSNQF